MFRQAFGDTDGTKNTHRVWQGTGMMQGDTVLASTWQLRWQRWREKHVRLAWLTHKCCLKRERKICHYLRSQGHRLTVYRSKIRTQRLTEGWNRAGGLIHRWNRTGNDFEGETWLVRVNIAFKGELQRLPGPLTVQMVKLNFWDGLCGHM